MSGLVSRRRVLVGLGGVGLTAIPGCLDTDTEPGRPRSADVTVELTSAKRFVPSTVSVSRGQTVRWVNNSSPLQTVTADEDEIPTQQSYFASGGFKREILARIGYPLMGALRTGERYDQTFEHPGTYGYYSIPFESEGMEGTVIVE